MSANHLIIGLGGTGAKIIRSFRKTIFQEFRKENSDGANQAYLYVSKNPVDISPAMVAELLFLIMEPRSRARNRSFLPKRVTAVVLHLPCLG